MSVFLTSLQNVLPIILIIVLGYVLRKINWLNETFAGQASKLIMNVALPSSIFVAVLKNLSLNQLLQLGPSTSCYSLVPRCLLQRLALLCLMS